jgi:hypothetical protein
VSFRGRVPKLCKRQLSARPGVAISYSPSIPPRRPVIKSLSREGRRTGGEPFTHSTHSSPPQGDQIPQPGGSPRWRGTFLCGAAVWRRAVRRCGGNGGVAVRRAAGVADAAVWRKAVLRCFERRCCEKLVQWCGGNADAAEKLMLWCGKTAVLRNCGAAVVDLVGLWRLADIRAASQAAPVSAFNCGQRSCDQLSPKLAADCDGGGDFRGESFGSPVFSGVRGGKLA